MLIRSVCRTYIHSSILQDHEFKRQLPDAAARSIHRSILGLNYLNRRQVIPVRQVVDNGWQRTCRSAFGLPIASSLSVFCAMSLASVSLIRSDAPSGMHGKFRSCAREERQTHIQGVWTLSAWPCQHVGLTLSPLYLLCPLSSHVPHAWPPGCNT